MVKNRDLKSFYDGVYKNGEKTHYTSLAFCGDKVPLAKEAVLKEIDWEEAKVLDAGCGTGELAYLIAKEGAEHVLGVDYSEIAIKEAKEKYNLPNLNFLKKDIGEIDGKFDIIVSLGTLEHLDDPIAALEKLKSLLAEDGSLIITCPNWTNIRGYILQALRMLFDAKITLADIHYFVPQDFKKFAQILGMNLTWRTVDYKWGNGDKMFADLRKRLTPVLADDQRFSVPQEKIDDFIDWLEKAISLEHNYGEETLNDLGLRLNHRGAIGLYHFYFSPNGNK